MTKQSETKQNPIISLRDGNLKVAVWDNKTEDGKIFYSINLTRSYKHNEQWQETHILNTDDLLKSARLLQRAYDEILLIKQS